MELRQLRSLLAVKDAKTFVGAARNLNVAQPALSRQIRSLERELGTAVFYRTRGGVTPTASGEICLRAAQSVIGKADAAIRDTRLASAGKVGSCTIFVSQWCVWTGFTARVLAYLAKHDPGIDVVVREGQIGTQWECLRRRYVDLSIATPPQDASDDLASETLLDDFVGTAILAPSHPFANRNAIRLEDMADQVLLTYESGVQSPIEILMKSELEKAGFRPERVITLSTTESLIARVSAGLGWSVHRNSLRGKIPGVATVPLENFGFSVPVSLIHRADETQSHVLEVAHRIREVAAVEYPEMYHQGETGVASVLQSPASSLRTDFVEIRDLRYFAAVIEEQGIGRAAARLGLTQPGLSRQIRALERETGVPLVARASRGIVPTEAGRTLYKAARSILGEVSKIPAQVERTQRAAAGRCVIAALPSGPVRELLGAVMRTAGEKLPHLELSVINVPTPQQPAGINDGELDIGLCHPFFNLTAGYPDLEYRELLEDQIDAALLPLGHPLAVRESIPISELSEIPFVFFRRDFHPGFHDYLLDAFRKLGYEPVIGPTQNGLHTLWSMCEAGAGWTIAFGAHRKDPPRGLVAVPIERLRVPWGVNLLSRKQETRPATLAVIDLLFEEATKRNAVPQIAETESRPPALTS